VIFFIFLPIIYDNLFQHISQQKNKKAKSKNSRANSNMGKNSGLFIRRPLLKITTTFVDPPDFRKNPLLFIFIVTPVHKRRNI